MTGSLGLLGFSGVCFCIIEYTEIFDKLAVISVKVDTVGD